MNKKVTTLLLAGVMLLAGATSALAATNNGTQSMSTTTAEVSLPDGYQNLSITVNEVEGFGAKSAYTITAETAAELAAQYIWDVLGESIDGMVVEMSHLNLPSSTRTQWHGLVLLDDSVEIEKITQSFVIDGVVHNETFEIEVRPVLFSFMIDAITGERISLFQELSSNRFDDIRTDSAITRAEMSIARAQLALRNSPLSAQFETEQLEAYMQLAREYAEKHFNTSTIANIDYVRSHPLFFGRNNHTGRIEVTSYTVTVSVVDNTGREALVTIITESKQLHSIDTQHNDIATGFNTGGGAFTVRTAR